MKTIKRENIKNEMKVLEGLKLAYKDKFLDKLEIFGYTKMLVTTSAAQCVMEKDIKIREFKGKYLNGEFIVIGAGLEPGTHPKSIRCIGYVKEIEK
jgi:ribosomal protein L6P/L9E